MWRFLTDEDMPRSTAVVLRQAGYWATDVRDVGLRGHSDLAVFRYAQAHNATLISCDKGFSNIHQFPLGTHAGIVVVRIPDEVPVSQMNDELIRALTPFQDEDLAGLLMIVELGRVCVRRPSTGGHN
jgi:predicted nuclease of predicted toxin-antitoxin system